MADVGMYNFDRHGEARPALGRVTVPLGCLLKLAALLCHGGLASRLCMSGIREWRPGRLGQDPPGEIDAAAVTGSANHGRERLSNEAFGLRMAFDGKHGLQVPKRGRMLAETCTDLHQAGSNDHTLVIAADCR